MVGGAMDMSEMRRPDVVVYEYISEASGGDPLAFSSL
tara:strand:+ start:408 stop:518 length:111 start_codon:yes stop_codon:yes gene_type:complete